MISKISESIIWGHKQLTIETGEIAKQADGAVLVRFGNTVLLCTCVYSKNQSQESAFFPLTVNYIEKFYAAGRLPGGFVKREGKPSEHEILIARLIDRPIRPLFLDGFNNEVQIVCTLLSYDTDCSPDIAAMIGASAAISISGVPFNGPIAGCRVGYSEETGYILNPNEKTQMQLVVAGTKDGILMVESEINELPEEIVLGAVMFGFESFQPVIELINKLKQKISKEVIDVIPLDDQYSELVTKIRNLSEAKLRHALNISTKLERQQAINNIKLEVIEQIGEDVNESICSALFEHILANVMRKQLIETRKRIDGRNLDQIRQINCEIDLLSQTHGSALFTRGETQALVVTTLGSKLDVQVIDDVTGESKETFLLHYNFLPFSVGEVGRLNSPGRREIGHGKLAWRALVNVMPNNEKFPYTVRVVSEITESNGSSSMATVCGTSLSLMAAGVPIKSHVAGIAMGLIKTDDDFLILSDIMGDEDHLGDMDFKVAGTEHGITALQMDIKINGISKDILKVALDKAKIGRMHILQIMNKTISEPRARIHEKAPRLKVVQIDKEKIRDLIGPGGKTIKDLCDRFKVKIEISEDGKLTVFALNKELMNQALNEINIICSDLEVGQIFTGTVSKITDFGAFVSIGTREGLLHISKISKEKVVNISDILHIGQIIKVKIIDIDDKNRFKLSMKDV